MRPDRLVEADVSHRSRQHLRRCDAVVGAVAVAGALPAIQELVAGNPLLRVADRLAREERHTGGGGRSRRHLHHGPTESPRA
jgi:hypothetical protein